MDVTAVDGARLGVELSGAGDETLLLIHGTCGGRGDWAFVAPRLGESHRVAALERRGRGMSGGATGPHSLMLEVSDIVAVIAALGGPVHLIGHSFGALCALGAAAEAPLIRSLVLYEPPAAAEHVHDADVAATVHLIDAGDLDGAAAYFLERVADIPLDEIAAVRAFEPPWASVRDGVRSAPREAAAVKRWRSANAAMVDTPTLLLRGELSTSPLFIEGAQRIRPLLGDAHDATLIGQRHLAIGFDPDQFVDLVQEFLRSALPPR